ncbi:alpha/beta hydrolase [Dyadobacter aurulentus]|uniref:alpha/beta hydrolase n=1 Tax=Dyadobacter sp. UC 10 TaxID=2605428 RepID=UPI0011F31E54|nr:alpha/beta hydrolase [Dyadobacter sp. UC 10]KAA0989217.1 alpha/beta hydrolase [Dyadobacter sp. UC 10]
MKKKQKKRTVRDYATDPNLSREVREFLKIVNTSGGPALETLPLADAQAGLSSAQASVEVDVSGIKIDLKTITSDGYTVDLHIVRPETATGTLPAFMFIHGGGWILGDFPTHHRLVRDIVLESGMAAVFVNYSRTSEAPYPQAINEIYAATKWVAANGEKINVDGSKLAVVGNSVGGNMSTVTCLMAKEKGGPEIKLQVMMWPIVDADFETKSYQKFGKDRFLSTSLMKWMYDLYIGSPEERKTIYASPLQATLEQLKGLPPALIQTAENDILRDEGEAYGRKLDEAGVPVTTVRYNGMIHDFGLLNGLATLPAVRSHIRQIGAELKNYLV